MLSKDNVQLLVEFVGTFIFLSVIINTTNVNKGDPTNPLSIAVALLAAIYFGGRISGGHFNPAVTILFRLQDPTFTDGKVISYIMAQVAGAVAAGHMNNIVLAAK